MGNSRKLGVNAAATAVGNCFISSCWDSSKGAEDREPAKKKSLYARRHFTKVPGDNPAGFAMNNAALEAKTSWCHGFAMAGSGTPRPLLQQNVAMAKRASDSSSNDVSNMDSVTCSPRILSTAEQASALATASCVGPRARPSSGALSSARQAMAKVFANEMIKSLGKKLALSTTSLARAASSRWKPKDLSACDAEASAVSDRLSFSNITCCTRHSNRSSWTDGPWRSTVQSKLTSSAGEGGSRSTSRLEDRASVSEALPAEALPAEAVSAAAQTWRRGTLPTPSAPKKRPCPGRGKIEAGLEQLVGWQPRADPLSGEMAGAHCQTDVAKTFVARGCNGLDGPGQRDTARAPEETELPNIAPSAAHTVGAM
mmetsp:Transcript_81281/g.226297  ORF Transcript_81281/g.226297 Transcript_81281/m.226297 type:complete len:370 (+) Transcript_81281:2009-3118(+)